jgi:ribosomal protein L37AE/L43A
VDIDGTTTTGPTCPRCGTTRFVARGVPGLQPSMWSCRRCRARIECMWLEREIQRLIAEAELIARQEAHGRDRAQESPA